VTKRKAKGRPVLSRSVPDQSAQPGSNEQSGSTGRNTEVDKLNQGKDTGQDRYGQSGLGGAVTRETIGQANYRTSESSGARASKSGSNEGSGRAGQEAAEYEGRRKPA
jgi:hypothetical protein